MLDRSFNLAALRALPIFAPLGDDELEHLRLVLSVSSRSVGDLVIEEGSPGSELFVLLDGEAKVIKGHRRADERVLATLRPIETIGEMALLTDRPRSATVVATATCRLLTLTRQGLFDVLLTHPSICVTLLQDAYRRIAALQAD